MITWTEVANVAIKRGFTEKQDAPLMFRQHVAEGTLEGGRKFDIGINIGGGDFVFCFPAHGDDPTRVYVVRAGDVVEAILRAETLG